MHQEQCVSGISDSFGLILPRFKQRFTFLSQKTGKHRVMCVFNTNSAAVKSVASGIFSVFFTLNTMVKYITIDPV